MSLTRAEVAHVARLAHIELQPDEIATLAEQLSTVLDHIERLQRVDTEDVEPTAHIAQVQNVMRDDEVTPSWHVEAVVANAPHRLGDFIEVQAVLD